MRWWGPVGGVACQGPAACDRPQPNLAAKVSQAADTASTATPLRRTATATSGAPWLLAHRPRVLAARAAAWSVPALVVLAALAGCSPIIRDATFRGAKDRVAEASLLGPFDGQVVDVSTSEPVQGATVVGIWSYDQGDGLIGPHGSETAEVKTDRAGRYRIPDAPLSVRGRYVRLVSFVLVVYKRGFVGYRSDLELDGRPRTDFSLRHNRVELRKWRDTDSHADHLLFLSPPPAVQKLAGWERDAANLDLYRRLGGELAAPVEPETPEAPALQLLDASELLRPEEVRRRTGFTGPFDVGELGDLARTHFYHGVHLQAIDREEEWDVAYRVWKDPPGGLDPVIETFEATLPGVKPSGEVTDETWIYDAEGVRAVAFLDREANVGVLLTCGAKQCVDIDAAIILASYIHDRLESIRLVDAPSVPATPAGPRGPLVPGKEAPPGGTPQPKPEDDATPPAEPPPAEPPPAEPEAEAEPTAPPRGGGAR
jgi:hypothetical protein